MKKIIIVAFVLNIVSAFSQNRFIDSLKGSVTAAKEDTGKVFLLTDIAEELTNIDFKASLTYANKGLQLAEKLNFRKGIAQAYNAMANAYSDQSDYVHCLEYNNKALDIRNELGNTYEIAASLDNIGNVYNDQGNFTKALEYYGRAVVIDVKNNDKESLSTLYNNMGNAYANKGDLKQSITYLFKSMKLKEEFGNKKGVANTYNNLAVIYKMQGNYTEALRCTQQALNLRTALKDSMGIAFSHIGLGLIYINLNKDDEAEENFLQALPVFTRSGYKKGVAAANNSLGIIYKRKKQYNKALRCYEAALQIFTSQNDKMGQATALSNLASVYGKSNDKILAASYFKQAEASAGQAGSIEVWMDLYSLYSTYYEDNADFKNALKYHLLYAANRDSLRSKENSEAMAEVKARYETDIKENENNALKNENKIKDLTITQKNTQRNIFIILFAAVVIIGSLLYGWLRLKKREELNRQLIVQKDLRSKAIIEAEEKERLRIARELHDGIGQQLSAAKLNIAGLQGSINAVKPEEKEMLRNALDLIDESVKEVRAVSHSMMPNALVKSGLVIALREFINKISASGHLKINLEVTGISERLDHTTESIIFRVLQEIVNNIIRHAEASEISIQFLKHLNEVTVMVEDNGIGFDVEAELKKAEGGIGLKNIQSRIAFLNGDVFFDSYPGKGTTVTIEIKV